MKKSFDRLSPFVDLGQGFADEITSPGFLGFNGVLQEIFDENFVSLRKRDVDRCIYEKNDQDEYGEKHFSFPQKVLAVGEYQYREKQDEVKEEKQRMYFILEQVNKERKFDNQDQQGIK